MFFQESKGWLYGITTVAIIVFFIAVTYILDFEDPILTGILIGSCCSGFAFFSTIVERRGF
ncbi:hypothetical protein [Campylobacter concisus]